VDNSADVLWLIIGIVVVGVLIYVYRARRATDQAQQQRLSLVRTASNHFADLAARGIQIKLIAGEAPNIALRNGEHLLCVFPNTSLLEPRAVRTWLSNYGGASIRVAKGLSFRAGQSRGVSESHDEMRSLDLGTLLLTNERLVFIGSQRTNSVALNKVIDIEGLTDAVVVHREGKEKSPGARVSVSVHSSDLSSGCQRAECGNRQIERIEPFGKPGVNESEEITGFIPLALIAPEPRHAHRGAQLPGFTALPLGDVYRLTKRNPPWLPDQARSSSAGIWVTTID